MTTVTTQGTQHRNIGPALFWRRKPPKREYLNDIELLKAGAEYDEKGRLRYLWRHLRLRRNGTWETVYQVVRLYVLTYLPADEAQLASRHQAMARVLRGLLRSGVTPVYLKIVNPKGEGVAQVYGVSVLDGEKDRAVQRSQEAAAALLAALKAAYPQSGYEPPDLKTVVWIDDAFRKMPYTLVLRGHPDPREAASSVRVSPERGMEDKTGMGRPQEIGLRQGEIVSQGMMAQSLPMVQVTMYFPIGETPDQGRRELTLLYQRLARAASVFRSLVQGTGGISVGLGIPIITSVQVGEGSTAGYGISRSHTAGRTHAVSVARAHTDGWSYVKSRGHSVVHSEFWSEAHTAGGSHSVGIGHTVGRSRGTSLVRSESHGVADTRGWADTEGVAHTEGTARTVGTAHTSGSSTSHSSSTTHVPQVTTHSISKGASGADPQNPPTTIQLGISGRKVSSGSGYGEGQAETTPAVTKTDGASVGTNSQGSIVVLTGGVHESENHSVTRPVAPGHTTSQEWTQNKTVTFPDGAPDPASLRRMALDAVNVNDFSDVPQGVDVGVTAQTGRTVSNSETWTTTPAHTVTVSSFSHGSFSSTTHSEATTVSSATTHSHSHTESGSHTVSRSTGVARGTSEAESTAESRTEVTTSSWAHTVAHGRGIAEGWSESESHGVSGADTRSTGESLGVSSAVGTGIARAQALTVSRGVGLGVGLSPTLTLSRSYQLTDYEAAMAARVLEEQMQHVEQIIKGGGVYADTYFLVPALDARRALQALAHQAYHGTEEVVTPVQVLSPHPDEEMYVRTHAYLLLPTTVPEESPYALEGWRYSSLMTLPQAAALAVPEVFEYGVARTVAKRLPRYALHHFDGEILLGHQWSSDLNRFTDVPLHLPLRWFTNGFVAGASGAGKSVLLGRIAYELQKQGVLVFFFDLGDGQRDLIHVLEPGRYELRGIAPNHPRRMKWNPLQVARRIHPEDYIDLVVEVISNAGALGPKQRTDLGDALKALYLDLGVLTDYEEIWDHPRWGRLDGDDLAAVNAERRRRGREPRPEGEHRLADLEEFELQAVAVRRSGRASFTALYRQVERIQAAKPGGKRGGASQDSIEGLKNRLRPLMRRTIDPGRWLDDPEPLDGYRDRLPDGGVVLIEGVGIINEYVKAVWFSLAVSVLFLDAVARFNVSEEEDPGARQEVTVIYDEGNKLLTAGATVAVARDRTGPQTAPIFVKTLREGRKYKFRSVIGVQDPEDVPEAIITNCSVYFAGPIRSEKGLRVVMTKMGLSPTGFVRNEYWEDFAKRQKYVFATRFAMADRREDQEPCLLVAAPLPTVRIYDRYLPTYFHMDA